MDPIAPDQEKQDADSYRPRTALGQRLWEIRTRIVATGEPLPDWDGLRREVAQRRGGAED